MSQTTDDVSALVVLGTRPEIIKLAPLVREWESRELPLTLLHTGQHYSENLDSIFFDRLELDPPDDNLGVGSKSHGEQTGEMIAGIERIVLEDDPDVVFVQGDTNTVLAGAIATSKLEASLGHVESGLRSFDRAMPEETNRRLTDHAADYLFAPTPDAERQLLAEDLDDDRIAVTGNTVVDAVLDHIEMAEEKSTVLEDLGLVPGKFGLVTVHRASNVDTEATFADIFRGLERVGRVLDIELVYPIHPRAKDRMAEFGLSPPDRVRLVEPLDYLDFLRAQSTARIVLTDSGGVQEESCVLQTPCVTLRDNTERPETIHVGANRLVGTEPDRIERGAREMVDVDPSWSNPFGDGTAAESIVDFVLEREGRP